MKIIESIPKKYREAALIVAITLFFPLLSFDHPLPRIIAVALLALGGILNPDQIGG